jgi:hypothetical protein
MGELYDERFWRKVWSGENVLDYNPDETEEIIIEEE